jgi:hypothetical protein
MEVGRKASIAEWGRDSSSGMGRKMEMTAQIQAAISSGRIVPTEARPSELSGCIVGAGEGSVKNNPKYK